MQPATYCGARSWSHACMCVCKTNRMPAHVVAKQMACTHSCVHSQRYACARKCEAECLHAWVSRLSDACECGHKVDRMCARMRTGRRCWWHYCGLGCPTASGKWVPGPPRQIPRLRSQNGPAGTHKQAHHTPCVDVTTSLCHHPLGQMVHVNWTGNFTYGCKFNQEIEVCVAHPDARQLMGTSGRACKQAGSPGMHCVLAFALTAADASANQSWS